MGSDDSHPAGTHRATPEAAKTKATGELSVDTRYYLGDQLRAFYTTVLSGAQPQHLLDLLTQLDAALAARQTVEAAAFRQGLHDALPSLRAFAISLTANAAQADDLVQEILLKAWTNQHRFAPGTNLIAWLITIARNAFYSERRRRKREVEDANGEAAGQLIALPCQEHGIALQQVWLAMAALPAPQREALMLVGAQGMTYEAAAELLACQVGTVKSRVSRARSHLADTLAFDRQRAWRHIE